MPILTASPVPALPSPTLSAQIDSHFAALSLASALAISSSRSSRLICAAHDAYEARQNLRTPWDDSEWVAGPGDAQGNAGEPEAGQQDAEATQEPARESVSPVQSPAHLARPLPCPSRLLESQLPVTATLTAVDSGPAATIAIECPPADLADTLRAVYRWEARYPVWTVVVTAQGGRRRIGTTPVTPTPSAEDAETIARFAAWAARSDGREVRAAGMGNAAGRGKFPTPLAPGIVGTGMDCRDFAPADPADSIDLLSSDIDWAAQDERRGEDHLEMLDRELREEREEVEARGSGRQFPDDCELMEFGGERAWRDMMVFGV